MKYTADYFIQKFGHISPSFWNEGFQNKPDGTHCALGHCNDEQEQFVLARVLNPIKITITESKYGNKYYGIVEGVLKVAAINNGETFEYQQPTPKERILAALQDVKAFEQN